MIERKRRVIVVGSGAAGMAAALSAAASGARVTVLEKAPRLGGTTAMSGGGIWVPSNPWAAAAGVFDDADLALTYLRNLPLGDVDPAMCETYVRTAVDVLAAIEDWSDVTWQHLAGWPDYHCELEGGCRQGRSLEIMPIRVHPDVLARVRPNPYDPPLWTLNEEAGTHRPPTDVEVHRRRSEGITMRGRGLIAALLAAFERLGGDIRTSAGEVDLVTSGRAITGVRVGSEQLDGAVILASGGFERDPELTRTFLGGPVLAPGGPPSNTGDGLRLGMAVGASLGNMSEAWWCAGIHVGGEEIDGAPFYRMLFLDLGKPGGLLVDRHGRRFVNEATNYNDLGRVLHDIDGPTFERTREQSWFVFDATRHCQFPIGYLRAPGPRGDAFVCADSIIELAGAIGIDPGVLEATVETFNGEQRASRDSFGRGTYIWDAHSTGGGPPRPVLDPPFYAMRVLAGCLGTKGGLKTDSHGRVLGADRNGPIDGLFAAGNVAASPFGCAYPGPGSTVGPALVFGTRAGQAAAG